MSQKIQTISSLQDHAQQLMHQDAPVEHYSQAVQALAAALEQGSERIELAPEEKDAFCRRLILQPAPGMHQLAFHACHFATSNVLETVHRVVATMRHPLLRLLENLDRLTPDAQRRCVVFAVTTRAFSKGWLTPETISALHKEWFARFDPNDLSLPYNVIFHSGIFGQNRDDLLERFLPQGSLEVIEGLSPYHALLLAWLSGSNVFTGKVTLADLLQSADLSDLYQMSAARSLLMRFGDGARAPDAALMDQLGLSGLALKRRHLLPSDAQNTKLQKIGYQAICAGLNRVKTALPFLAALQRKPKVGLCISGQLRGYEDALATWKARLFPLIETHIFVHSWYDVGRSGAQPSRDVLPFEGAAFSKAYRHIGTTLGFEEMQRRYPSLFEQLNLGGRVTQAGLSSTYDTEHVVLEDDKDSGFSGFSNPQKMHYKIHAADALARSEGDFDLLMRLRPDLSIRDIGFDWHDLFNEARSRPVLFAEKGFGVHYGGLMIGDQCAIATPEVMQTYARTWSLFPEFTAVGFAKMPTHFSGHTSLAQTCWLGGLDVRRAPIRFGTLNEARRLSAAECFAAIEADSTGTSEDLELLEALRADL